jgi:hypothetical protein
MNKVLLRIHQEGYSYYSKMQLQEQSPFRVLQ